MSEFEIRILEQHWLGEADTSYDSSLMDGCSHGRIRLLFAGQVIEDGKEEYSISVSALHLLRTLGGDYSGPGFVSGPLICHGCGAILDMNCNIGIDWRVLHIGPNVLLDQIVRYDSNDLNLAKRATLSASLSFEAYCTEIMAFARRAKEFFIGIEKRFDDDFSRSNYESFWQEYDRLLSGHDPGSNADRRVPRGQGSTN